MDVSNGKRRVLVFEWLVGGGLLVDTQPLEDCSSMFRQGALMRRAIAEDFAAAGCEVLTTTDGRWSEIFEIGELIAIASGEELPGRLRELANKADFLFVIAPESEGRLVRVLDWLEPFTERLLSPERKWAELFSDKQATCDWLQRLGVRVPSGRSWLSGHDVWPPSVALPAVCKPNDGCGGEGIRLVFENWGDESRLRSGQWRIETLVEGEAVSVVALLGGKERVLLQPTRQLFSSDAFGVYAGGEMIVDEQLVAAVWRAVEPALKALEGVRGVVGFDLVLERETCAEQWRAAGEWLVTVVEVNPRLTSSYLGLREYYGNNLADCLLRLVGGEPLADSLSRRSRERLSWRLE
jgi:predicted ATP-grasp superfamily ATP-dependent carboligase